MRECFGRVVYAHKTHEKEADLCGGVLRRLKIAQILLSSITASGALAIVFFDPFWLKAITALISIVTAAVSTYMKGFNPGATAQKHRDTGADLWAIRESYLSLLTDISAGTITANQAMERRDKLQEQLAAIYKSAPHTTPKAYLLAQQALQKFEDYTFTPGEIDAFVPPHLKRDHQG